MTKKAQNKIYTKNVIEFITIAKEYCAFVEDTDKLTAKLFLEQSQMLLPLLYLKTSMLSKFESISNENNEKFVSEEDWNYIKNKIAGLLGEMDIFVQVIEPISQFDDDAINVSLSEIFADIYQDLRDTIAIFAMGDENMMNDALWECKLNFEQYWGQRTIIALSTIHNINYGAKDIPDDNK